MKKTYLSIIMTLLFFLTTTSMVVSENTQIQSIIMIPTPTGNTIYVDDDNTHGPWNGTIEYPYQYIHDGVNHAVNGDTVFVLNGEYYEHVLLNKTLQLLGENPSSTIIDGTSHEFIIAITADGATVQNFTMQNSGAGMKDA